MNRPRTHHRITRLTIPVQPWWYWLLITWIVVGTTYLAAVAYVNVTSFPVAP